MTAAIASFPRSCIVHLGVIARCEATRVDINDAAVNFLREYGREMGWDRSQLTTLLGEELARIRAAGIDLTAVDRYGKTGLGAYYRVKRTGSAFRISRHCRSAIFCLLATRAAG